MQRLPHSLEILLTFSFLNSLTTFKAILIKSFVVYNSGCIIEWDNAITIAVLYIFISDTLLPVHPPSVLLRTMLLRTNPEHF